MKKVIGIVIALIGLAGVASTISQINAKLPAQISSIVNSVPSKYMLIGSLIVLIVGAALAFTGSRGGKEIPIYQGNKVIGYRRN